MTQKNPEPLSHLPLQVTTQHGGRSSLTHDLPAGLTHGRPCRDRAWLVSAPHKCAGQGLPSMAPNLEQDVKQRVISRQRKPTEAGAEAVRGDKKDQAAERVAQHLLCTRSGWNRDTEQAALPGSSLRRAVSSTEAGPQRKAPQTEPATPGGHKPEGLGGHGQA